jgi:hypothetical protein
MMHSMASASALEFAEGVHLLLDKDKGETLTLAWDYPTGSLSEPLNLRKLESGMLLQDSEAELLPGAMLQRGVVRQTGAVLGAPDDSAKTLELFKRSAEGGACNVSIRARPSRAREFPAEVYSGVRRRRRMTMTAPRMRATPAATMRIKVESICKMPPGDLSAGGAFGIRG